MTPLYYLKGTNGQLSLYEDHLTITRKGFLQMVSHLKCKETNIKYSELRDTGFRKGWFFISGFLHFMGASTKSCGLIEAATDPNCIVFRSYENKNARIIKDFLAEKAKEDKEA